MFTLLGVATLALITVMPAAAHVTVQPGEAAKGGYAKLAFRVPSESATAGTIKLAVSFPQDTPLASVRTKPMTGWTAEIHKEKLATPIKTDDGEITDAVRTVTWTAQPGVRIGPNEFTEFEISAGPLPDNTDRLLFPAVQTYDDGKVVSWDQPPPADGAQEPEHPAPALRLIASASDHDAAAPATASSAAPALSGNANVQRSEAQPAIRDDTARWLSGAALAVAALGLGVGGGALLVGRRRVGPRLVGPGRQEK